MTLSDVARAAAAGLRLQGPLRSAQEVREACVAVTTTLEGLALAPGELVGVHGQDASDQAIGFLAVCSVGAVPALLVPGLDAEHLGARPLDVRGARCRLGARSDTTLMLPEAAYVQLSGGTTGAPAGIVVGEQGAQAQWRMTSARADSASVVVGWLPLHHDMGLVTQLLMPASLGLASVLLDARAWLRDPVLMLDAVEQHRATHAWMPTFGFLRCLRRIPDDVRPRDLSSLRLLGCGGERADPEVLDGFLERFEPWGLDPAALTVGYGMAEAVCGVTMTAPGRPRVLQVDAAQPGARLRLSSRGAGSRVASCGVPAQGLQVAVRAAGQTLDEGAVGQLHVSGPTLGRSRIVAGRVEPLVPGDGWLPTGDLGFLDDGEVFVLERLDDCLVVAGRNVPASSIEAAARHAAGPDTGRVAAFAVRAGAAERLVVIVDAAGATPARGDDLRGAVRAAVLRSCRMLPVDVVIADPPLVQVGSSGKVSRKTTRDAYLRLRGGPPALGPGDVLAVLHELSGARAEEDALLSDLGLDSLALVEVLEVVGQADASEDLAQLPRDATVRDLTALLLSEARPSAIPRHTFGPPPHQHRQSRAPLSPLRPERGPLLRGRAAPYLPARRVLARLAAQSALRERWAGDALELVRTALGEAGTTADLETVLRVSTENNVWHAWRRAAFNDAEVRRRWLRVEGREHVTGRGSRGLLLLLPHTPLTHLLTTDELWAPDHVVKGQDLPPTRRAAHLTASVRVLRAGGTVVLLPDEFATGSGVQVDVGGRPRLLGRGLGHLAEQTDAVVVPWFPAAGHGFSYTSRFHPPLSAGGVDSLVEEYGELLDDFWRGQLGLVAWEHLRRHAPALDA